MTSLKNSTGNTNVIPAPPMNRSGSMGRVQNCIIDENKMCTVHKCGTREIKVSVRSGCISGRRVCMGLEIRKLAN